MFVTILPWAIFSPCIISTGCHVYTWTASKFKQALMNWGSRKVCGWWLPASVTRQTASPIKVCWLTPIERTRAFTPPVGQWPAGWQLHTLMVKVLVLERAGEPLSVTTTGRRYSVRSLRVKVLLRAMMLAVLSKTVKSKEVNFSAFLKKHEDCLDCERWYFEWIQSWTTSRHT